MLILSLRICKGVYSLPWLYTFIIIYATAWGMDFVITTKEDSESNVTTEMLERINEKSIGYVKSLSPNIF